MMDPAGTAAKTNTVMYACERSYSTLLVKLSAKVGHSMVDGETGTTRLAVLVCNAANLYAAEVFSLRLNWLVRSIDISVAPSGLLVYAN
uniref:Uncharacterized protein n=1 Tax=Mycobacterium leprae TaxID=1769 RepID=O33043_MYCLR|nr:hypothetical protein MLCB250.71c [Mycobacterium leprae]